MARRTVVSVSVSELNPDAVVVAEALKARGISLTCGGSRILAWAAAHLTAPPHVLTPQAAIEQQDLGISDDEFDALLDDL